MLVARENPGAGRNVSREQIAAFERNQSGELMSGMGAWPPTRRGAECPVPGIA